MSYAKSNIQRHWGITIALLMTSPAAAQTYVQLADLDPNNSLGPRLTATVASNKLSGNHLFAAIGSKITLIDAVSSPAIVYEFASDPMWNRVLFGQKDIYIYQFKNEGSSLLPLEGPGGIDISASQVLFVADRMNVRVLLARFDPQARTLTQVAVTPSDDDLNGVTDVARDGGSTPLTNTNFFALDGTGRVSYWQWTSGSPVKVWGYGGWGSGVGQFSGPRGICVGHTAAYDGGSVFTSDFYVADAGNKRIAWLQRTGTGATWMNAVTLPDNGVPADCTVDHFGNVTVADSRNSRLLKYTWNLNFLALYGSYGSGATNDNTFAHPHAVHAPFGTKKNASNQTIWYGEGRVITAEDWGSESGAREHYLGVDGQITSEPPDSVFSSGASISYNSTDVAYATVLVEGANGMATVVNNSLYGAGSWGAWWNGHLDNGSVAPDGNYAFNVTLFSAYGCPNNFYYTWCRHSFISNNFYFHYCPPPAGPISRPYDPCQPLQAPQVANSAPTSLFLRQRILAESRPLTRISGSNPAVLYEPSPSAAVDLSAGGGTLRDVVRQYGVRGLSFGVTLAAAAEPAEIRVYSLSGRPIRTLVAERLDPGVYEVGWDGNDDRGRPAAPGVYQAVMTIGPFRATQRLILRQP